MSKKELKDLLKERLRAFTLINIMTGEGEIALIDIVIVDKTLKEYHKKGFIFEDLFNENKDDIIRWSHLREIVNERRSELRELKETLEDYKKTLRIYGDKEYFRLRVPFYEEQINKLPGNIFKKENILNRLLREYRPLNRKIKTLKKASLEKVLNVE